jgi:hypothetical protein
MGEKLSTWKILFFLFFTHANASSFTSDTVISITVGILDRYHSTCVYLLQSMRQQGECHDSCHIISFLCEHGDSVIVYLMDQHHSKCVYKLHSIHQ